MKINGDITILTAEYGVSIELRCMDSRVTFSRVNLTSEQFCKALSRTAHVQCDVSVYGLDKVTKKHENKDYEFRIPDDFSRKHIEKERREQDLFLSQIAQAELDFLNEGWIAESYFSSQTSFFNKGDEKWARVTIRRWV